MMHAFVESDESTDSDDNGHSSIITHSRVEPLNWYIANHEWSMGHMSREANQSSHTYNPRNQQDAEEQSESKIQECADLLRKKCHFRDRKEGKLKKCCACCCKKSSETSIESPPETKGPRTKLAPRNYTKDETSSDDEEEMPKGKRIPDKKISKIRDKGKRKKNRNEKSKSGKKHRGRTENELLTEMISAGAAADITKSCCYLCAQNSMAIVAARVARPTEQFTRGTQVTEKPHVRTVQSSVKVRTCDRSTDCPRSARRKRKKFKLKNFKSLSKYVKKMWPAEKTVACGSNTPIVKRTPRDKKPGRTCGIKECKRYASPDR